MTHETMNKHLEELENLNREIRDCRRCRLWWTRSNALCGEGDPNARLMLVAQAPGQMEDADGKMFIGPSGEVLTQLLGEAGVTRREIYMTNLVKCVLPRNRKPKQDEIDTCSGYLDEEIRLIHPSVISPLGYYATRYITDKYGIQVGPRSEFSDTYGGLLLFEGGKVFPLPHPAALLYDASREKEMTKMYMKLKVLLTDCRWYPVCPLKAYYEEGRIDGKWVELYCRGDWENCVRYEMVEKGEPHPDWMLPDGTMDERLR